MGEAAVHDIVDQIKELDQEDRLLLDQLVAGLEDEEWRREAAKARRAARRDGIGQAEIDRAVQVLRYGSSAGAVTL